MDGCRAGAALAGPRRLVGRRAGEPAGRCRQAAAAANHGLLYLDRYWRQEEQVRADLLAREAQPPPVVDSSALAAGLDRLFPGADARAAAGRRARRRHPMDDRARRRPGHRQDHHGRPRDLALLLTSPARRCGWRWPRRPGKAAARLQEAVQQRGQRRSTQRIGTTCRTLTASTLHRLLGWVPGRGTRFRHNRDNRLPFDVVVVDETSMVSLTMMARLLEAVRPDARLLLVGDPDQLASRRGRRRARRPGRRPDRPRHRCRRCAGLVGGGEPAGPRSRSGRRSVVLLRKTWRFGGDIAELAAAVRDGDADAAVAVLHRGGTAVLLVPPDEPGIRARCARRGDGRPGGRGGR